MTFPQLTASHRTLSLLNEIISAKNAEEAAKLFAGFRGGSVQRSRFEKKLKLRIAEMSGEEKPIGVNQNNLSDQSNSSNFLFDLFFKPAPVKTQTFISATNPEKYRQTRLAKWNLVAENLARMDSQILKDYRERRTEFKNKSKKNNYPF